MLSRVEAHRTERHLRSWHELPWNLEALLCVPVSLALEVCSSFNRRGWNHGHACSIALFDSSHGNLLDIDY
jgi:hypothetical protein